MTSEQARIKIDFLDFYLQKHANDYSEEEHTAMMMAIEALRSSEKPNKCEIEILRRELLERGDEMISFQQLVERFDAVEEEYPEQPWNLKQIYNNFNILIGEKSNKWIPVNQPPKVSGRYIVTRHFCNNDFVEMASYSVDLHRVDKYDFPKHKAGWYNYDSEYGHYELDDIVAWMPSPESFKGNTK